MSYNLIVISTDSQQDAMAELKLELQKLKMEVRKLRSGFQGRSKPTLKLETQQNTEFVSSSFVTNAVINLDFYPPVKFYNMPYPPAPACRVLGVFQSLDTLLPVGYYKAYDNTTGSFSYVYCEQFS